MTREKVDLSKPPQNYSKTYYRVDGLNTRGKPYWTILKICEDFSEAETALRDAKKHWRDTRMVKEIMTRSFTLLVAPAGVDLGDKSA